MYILGLLKSQKALHIAEMAEECSVSERTIYRDINSLLKLGFLVQYNNGYKLTPEADLPANALDNADLGLIEFCLRFNPLARHPFFKRRFQTIQQKLSGSAESGNGSGYGLVLESPAPKAIEPSDIDNFAEFLRALQAQRKVRIKSNGTGASSHLFTPVAINLREGRNILSVLDDDSRPREFPVDEVAWVGVTDVPFIKHSARNYAAAAGERPLEKQVDAVK